MDIYIPIVFIYYLMDIFQTTYALQWDHLISLFSPCFSYICSALRPLIDAANSILPARAMTAPLSGGPSDNLWISNT